MREKAAANVYERERERERDFERLGEADLFLFGDREGDFDFLGEYDRRGLRERDFLLGDRLLECDRLRLLEPPRPAALSCLTRINATSP